MPHAAVFWNSSKHDRVANRTGCEASLFGQPFLPVF
ncbi:MAG: hypothetical protein JWM99_1781, partial [Verrucomicrobiales bacterium]|nr:hypothetical protein [Verrucomicrobiales bacterium]